MSDCCLADTGVSATGSQEASTTDTVAAGLAAGVGQGERLHGGVPGRHPTIVIRRDSLVTLADKGYQGSTWAKVPYKGKNKPEPQKETNRAHAKLRALGERANARLKTWRILRKLRCCPWRAGKLAKAIHVLQLREA